MTKATRETESANPDANRAEQDHVAAISDADVTSSRGAADSILPDTDKATSENENDQGSEQESESADEEELEAGISDAVPNEVKPAPPAGGTASAPASATAAPQDEDRRSAIEKQPYEFEHCTVQIAVQFLPDDGDAKGRPVLIGVRTHLDAPIVRMRRASELGELPPVITALVDELKSELPARAQATRERLEKEKESRAQKRAKAQTPKDARTAKASKPTKPKTVQTAAAPAPSVLTGAQREQAVTNASAEDKQQLTLF